MLLESVITHSFRLRPTKLRDEAPNPDLMHLATAVAQQQPNREARVAAAVQAKDVAAAAAIRAKQAENAAAIANATLVNEMGRQPVGSTLFCRSDPS
jgi:hypothetical protein